MLGNQLVAAGVYLATVHPLLCVAVALVCCLLAAVSYVLLLEGPRETREMHLPLVGAWPEQARHERRKAA